MLMFCCCCYLLKVALLKHNLHTMEFIHFARTMQWLGFPRGSGVKNPPAVWESGSSHGFDPWVRKKPWRRKWQPTPVFLAGESHGQRSLATKQHAVVWGVFIELCHCSCNLILEHFCFIPSPQKTPLVLICSNFCPDPCQPQVTANLPSVSIDLPFLGISCKWNYTIGGLLCLASFT